MAPEGAAKTPVDGRREITAPGQTARHEPPARLTGLPHFCVRREGRLITAPPGVLTLSEVASSHPLTACQEAGWSTRAPSQRSRTYHGPHPARRYRTRNLQ